MKQAGYSKRPRGRTPERYKQPQRHMNGDNGDTKMRGNPQQCVEKYLTLARDATSAGDPVTAENYYQYADHYYRLSVASRMTRAPERRVEPREAAPAENVVEAEGVVEAEAQAEETTIS